MMYESPDTSPTLDWLWREEVVLHSNDCLVQVCDAVDYKGEILQDQLALCTWETVFELLKLETLRSTDVNK